MKCHVIHTLEDDEAGLLSRFKEGDIPDWLEPVDLPVDAIDTDSMDSREYLRTCGSVGVDEARFEFTAHHAPDRGRHRGQAVTVPRCLFEAIDAFRKSHIGDLEDDGDFDGYYLWVHFDDGDIVDVDFRAQFEEG